MIFRFAHHPAPAIVLARSIDHRHKIPPETSRDRDHGWQSRQPLAFRDHHSASGPSRLPAASTANAVSQPAGLAGPPAASSATPTAHAPAADSPKPTVECSAIVVPRCAGTALALMPDVSAPESAGIVTAWIMTNVSSSTGVAVAAAPMASATAVETNITAAMARWRP